ncbi:MAG: hypothetical protein J5955_05865 [Bacilli bacterium]|nr:hypothetical protein [Bacilli bacterium]
MKKSHLTGVFVSAFALSVCAVAVAATNVESFNVKADRQTYTLNVNSTVFNMSGLTTTYQQNVVQDFGGHNPVLNYSLAKKDDNNNLVLAPAGRLFNYKETAEYKGRVTNILSLTINYSGGKLYVQEGLNGDATVYGEKVAVVSGETLNLVSHPNFIMVSNSKAATTITSMSISYSCSEAGFIVERLGEKYNCKSAEGNTYVMTRDGSNVSVAGQTGTIAVDSNGNFTITLSGGAIVYTGTVSDDYHTLTFSGKSGAYAAGAPTITEMKRMYVMADFENYEQRGTGYTGDQTSAFAASDLRADYFVDAGSGNGSTWVSGSSFKIPSTSNYLNLATNVAHSGSKSMLLQGQKAGWVRAWTRDVFNQSQHFNYGRGNKLSFWVHSGFNNPDATGTNASNVTIRAQVYYQNFVLTDSNRNSSTYGTGTKDFTISSGSGWKQCIIPLDPYKTVYAINIMISNSGISTDYVFMPIDDITIYTEPIFETKTIEQTATKFTRSYHGSVNMTVLFTKYTFTVKIALGANGYVYAYAGADMQPTDYAINGNQIVIHTEGSYEGQTFGTWTGTLSNNNNTITFNKSDIDGDVKSYITSNTITLTADTVFVSGSENINTLKSMITRQTGNPWVDYSEDDKLAFTNDYYVEGNNALAVKAESASRQRLIVNPTVAQSMSLSLDSVAFWFYVPANVSYSISIFTYKDYTPSTEESRYAQQWSKTYDGSSQAEVGWHYVNMGLNKKDGYGKNFAIYINSCSATIVLDYVTYF